MKYNIIILCLVTLWTMISTFLSIKADIAANEANVKIN